jgi:hypothetical protein
MSSPDKNPDKLGMPIAELVGGPMDGESIVVQCYDPLPTRISFPHNPKRAGMTFAEEMAWSQETGRILHPDVPIRFDKATYKLREQGERIVYEYEPADGRKP